MYKIFNKSANGYITCIFKDKKLGKQIVEEVTGKKTTESNLLEVTEEQRDMIQKLYSERNTDVVEEPEIPAPVDNTKIEELEEMIKEKSEQLNVVKKDLDKEKSKNATIMLGLMDTNNRLRELEGK